MCILCDDLSEIPVKGQDRVNTGIIFVSTNYNTTVFILGHQQIGVDDYVVHKQGFIPILGWRLK